MPVDANVCSRCGYNFNTGPFAAPPSPYASPRPPQSNYARPDYDAEPSSAADALGIASLIVGILAMPTVCLWCIAIPAGILALIFGAIGLKGRNRALAISGMICGGIAILFALAILIGILVLRGQARSGSPFGP